MRKDELYVSVDIPIFNVIFLGMIVWFVVEELLEGKIFAGTVTALIGAGFLGGLTYGIYSIVKSN